MPNDFRARYFVAITIYQAPNTWWGQDWHRTLFYTTNRGTVT